MNKISLSKDQIEQLPEILSSKQVAQILGKSEWAVSTLAKKGQIPCTRLGKNYAYSKSAILAMFEG